LSRRWRWRRYGLGRASGRLSRLRVHRAGVGLGAADDRPERGRVAGAYLERNRLWPGQVVLVLLELGVDLAHRRPTVLVDVGVVLARVALALLFGLLQRHAVGEPLHLIGQE